TVERVFPRFPGCKVTFAPAMAAWVWSSTTPDTEYNDCALHTMASNINSIVGITTYFQKFAKARGGLLRNSRKTDAPLAAAAEEFLKCLGPRSAAFALLRNSRKTDAPLAAAAEEFLKCLGPRLAAFALLRNS